MFTFKTLLAGLTLFIFTGELLMAEDFPYQAAVQSRQVEVRSGPGQSYYVTGNLKNGDRVTVHRHDPGGWYQIAPPAGSFSWIRADQVNRQGTAGIVINNDTIVRVGSSVEDRFDVEQRRLLAGDEVTILGEHQVNKNGKTISLYKISPPSLEYRWVKGDFLVPLNRAQQVTKANDPYAVPSEYITVSNTKTEYIDNPKAKNEMPSMEVLPGLPGDTRSSGDEPVAYINKQNSSKKSVTTKPKDPELEQIEVKFSPQMEAQEKKLSQLDDLFATMIKQDPSQWNLDGISREYSELQRQSLTPVLSHQIDLRLAAVGRYRKTKAQHDEVQHILNQTLTKDAQFSQEAMNIPVEGMTPMVAPPVAVPQIMPPSVSVPSALPSPPAASLDTTPAVIPGFTQAPPAAVPPTGIIPASASTQPGTTQPVIPAHATNAPSYQPGMQTPGLMPQTNYVQPAAATSVSPVQPQPALPAQNAFSGAGVLQRSIYWGKQGPSHVLISTQQGRILAYLQPAPGINLDGFLGRSIGVAGPRAFAPGIQADIIHVQQVSPVKLSR